MNLVYEYYHVSEINITNMTKTAIIRLNSFFLIRN